MKVKDFGLRLWQIKIGKGKVMINSTVINSFFGADFTVARAQSAVAKGFIHEDIAARKHQNQLSPLRRRDLGVVQIRWAILYKLTMGHQ